MAKTEKKRARRSAVSPTQRTRDYLKRAGITSAITERWNSFARVRQDLFGFADLVALIPGRGIVAIQVTSGTNVAARVAKIYDSAEARQWLECGGVIEVHGWRQVVTRTKTGAKAKRKKWAVRRLAVRLDCGAMVAEEIENERGE